MPVNLQSVPVTNTTDVRIALMHNGVITAALDPGDAQTLTTTFNQIGLFNPGHQPRIRNQNPPAAVAVQPGNLAYVSTGAGAVLLQYAPPGGQEQTVTFT